jgi:hypothetical protein
MYVLGFASATNSSTTNISNNQDIMADITAAELVLAGKYVNVLYK